VKETFTNSDKRERREAEVLDAALDIFSELGFKKASVDDIATKLGLSAGALYRYAADKKDLYRKAVARGFDLWQEAVIEAVARETDPIARFRVACRSAFSYLAGEPRLRRVLARDPSLFPFFEAEDPFSDINRASVELIEGIIRDGIAQGVFASGGSAGGASGPEGATGTEGPVGPERAAHSAARVIFSLYILFVQKTYVAGEEEEGALFESGLDLLLDGLRAR
jgi:AcrR family transcriptional regulator